MGKGAAMDDWKMKPLGIAVVAIAGDDQLAIQHVAASGEGVSLSGIWVLAQPAAQEVAHRLAHWLVTGTRGGLEEARAQLGVDLSTVDLASLVAACQRAEAALHSSWIHYRNAEPRKRGNLKPLISRSWPDISRDHDAFRLLMAAGKSPYPDSTPQEMRGIVAYARLVSLVLETWVDLESDRVSRPYLGGGSRQAFPIDWLAAQAPYWPQIAT